MSDPAVFTVTELAERWRCDPDVVRAHIRGGRLEGFKLGARNYRVGLDAVLAFEKAQTVKAEKPSKKRKAA